MSNKMNMNKASLDTSLAALTLNRDGARPLHAQIVEQLRRLILSGAVPAALLALAADALLGWVQVRLTPRGLREERARS